MEGYGDSHDDRKKVGKVNDEGLAGEVGIRSARGVRRRRVYVTPGAHAFVELEGDEVKSKKLGGPALVVEGPKVVKELVSEFLEDLGRPRFETLRDALDDLFEHVASETILVSRKYDAYEVEGRADPMVRARLQRAI